MTPEPRNEAAAFGQAFGRIMHKHPTADARLVNTILHEATALAAERAAPDAAGIDAETMTRALNRVWAMGWITMPHHESELVAQAILDALAAEKERP